MTTTTKTNTCPSLPLLLRPPPRTMMMMTTIIKPINPMHPLGNLSIMSKNEPNVLPATKSICIPWDCWDRPVTTTNLVSHANGRVTTNQTVPMITTTTSWKTECCCRTMWIHTTSAVRWPTSIGAFQAVRRKYEPCMRIWNTLWVYHHQQHQQQQQLHRCGSRAVVVRANRPFSKPSCRVCRRRCRWHHQPP